VSERLTVVEGDIRDTAAVAEVMQGIDLLYHQAAIRITRCAEEPRVALDVLAVGTFNVLEAAVAAGVGRVVAASSASVYGQADILPTDETHHPYHNDTIYGAAKVFNEGMLRSFADMYGLDYVGLRYFNVYGPGEAHKQRMASVAFHFFNQYRREGRVKLFEGSGGYEAGEQRRDFVSVEDVVKVNLYFFDHPEQSGIFNVATGQAQTFNEVATATINALRAQQREDRLSIDQMRAQGLLEYIAFPTGLKEKYQSFTQADIGQLRKAGYAGAFLTVEQGVTRYVEWMLAQ